MLDNRATYIGTFSKVLFPALRIGYLVLPADLVERFARVRDTLDVFPPTLVQAALADFINEGHFGRHLRRMRVLYLERSTALAEALTGQLGGVVRILGAEAGLHLVAALEDWCSGTEARARHGCARPCSGSSARRGCELQLKTRLKTDVEHRARELGAVLD